MCLLPVNKDWWVILNKGQGLVAAWEMVQLLLMHSFTEHEVVGTESIHLMELPDMAVGYRCLCPLA